MRAVVSATYGPPDVMRVEDIQKPTPTGDQIVIGVKAVSPNPADWHLLRGEPRFARLTNGLRTPKHKVLGGDVAGIVEEVGPSVTRFKPGDEVFGSTFEESHGGFAEFCAGSQDSFVVKPAGVSFEEAASVPTAAVTALQGLRKGGVKAGQSVLINGASGGVGHFGVQMAKSMGAEVTAVCSGRNAEMVRSIGASDVVDYTQTDFTKTGKTYDIILDAVGNRTVGDLRRALKPGGRCVVVGFTSLGLLLQAAMGPLLSMGNSRKVGVLGTASVRLADLEELARMLGSGAIKPVIAARYTLNETKDAVVLLEQGHVAGKLVIVP